jgi:tyrosinase
VGTHLFEVRAVDEANNVDDTPASQSFTVATTNTTPRIRKNQANLTAEEKSRFVAAVKALKANGTYDHHVLEHRTAFFMRPDPAHAGPAFFPWHRECLRRFELNLQAIDPSVTLPYWDPTVDNSPSSSIWGADFMGGNGEGSTWEVRSGPFAYSTGEWTLTVNDTSTTPPYLRRAFGVRTASLPTPTEQNAALSRTPYDVSPWDATSSTTAFRRNAESVIHNRVHQWVGQTMMQGASPNDPVFWLLHCYLDRLWARWQKRWPSEPYLPESGGPVGHNLNDPMWPWSSEASPPTPASVLDHRAFGYEYDDEASWT